MRTFLWLILGLAVTGAAYWVVTSDATPPQPLLIAIVALIFVVPPFGSFWMLYMVIRYEKHQMPYLLLAFIPYFFLGYYFDRIRGKSLSVPHARP